MEYATVCLVLISTVILAAWFVHSHGFTLFYGDAESHLNHARRILDGRNPGARQIGTPWLPIPHLLITPLAANFAWWQSGIAGMVPGAFCYVAAGLFFYAALKQSWGSISAAAAGTLALAWNPNLLYLSLTPMSEAVLLAAIAAQVFFALRFASSGSHWMAAAAGIASACASFTRYDGWFLIPFLALYLLLTGGTKRWIAATLFLAIAVMAPLAWLAHNWYWYGDPLEFYRGVWSHKMIYQRSLDAGGQRYGGDGDWGLAWLYIRTVCQACAGSPLYILGSIGFSMAAAYKRIWWPFLLLAPAPLFYLVSMHNSGTPIYVPTLWPGSWYNTRYGLAALPLISAGAGAIVLFFPRKLSGAAAAIITVAAISPWLLQPQPGAVITWKESLVNSEARRAWTAEASAYLRERYRPGDGIFASFSDLTGILRTAGIPLRENLHEGDDPLWTAALKRPDLFLHEEWAIAFSGDSVATAVQRLGLKNPRYQRVKIIAVKGGPVVEIYRRDRPFPTYDNSFHQSPRGEE